MIQLSAKIGHYTIKVSKPNVIASPYYFFVNCVSKNLIR